MQTHNLSASIKVIPNDDEHSLTGVAGLNFCVIILGLSCLTKWSWLAGPPYLSDPSIGYFADIQQEHIRT